MYQPTQADLAWVNQVISLIADGGKWLFPAQGQIYTVSHTNKTVTLTGGISDREMDEKTTATFAAVGYTVHYPHTGQTDDHP